MSTFGQALVSYAKTKLGQKEQGGENMGPIVDWSFALWTKRKPDETGWSKWCCGFASTCIYYTLVDLAMLQEAKDWLKKGSLSCTSFYNKNADCITPGKTPYVGSLILFGKDASNLHHIGIVTGVDTTYVYTIEGNAGNAVREKKYLLTDDDIYCYILLNY